VTWLLIFSLLPLLAQDTGALLEGAVTNALSGEAIRKCTVNLRRSDGKSYAILTDAEGRFHFANLEPGRYNLGGEKTGFARQEFGARGLAKPGSTITLDKGMQLKNLALKLTPQGVISGKVIDEEGDPVTGASVQVQRTIYIDGRKQLAGAGFAQTNDLGEYRIFGISPGRYYLSAAINNSVGGRSDENYPPTYYPGVVSLAAAGQLTVAPGSQLRSIDLALRKTRSVQLRGKFSGPAPDLNSRNGAVQLYPRGAAGMTSIISNSTPIRGVSGTFVLPNVLPGSYMLSADQTEEKDRKFYARVEIEVGNSNIDDLQVTLTAGVEIPGRLRIEGASEASLGNARVYLRVRDASLVGSMSGALKPDGTFTLPSVPPGWHRVVLSLPAPTLYIKSIRYGDDDALTNGLNVNGANRLEIVLGSNGGQIDIQTAPAANVGLIPKSGLQEFFKATTADSEGKCVFRGVAPGDYLLLAIEDAGTGSLADPEFVKQYEGSGEAVSVKAGSRETKQLKSIAAPDLP
jgi:hypothetical protein